MLIAVLFVAAALVGLFAMNRQDPPTHWMRLIPVAVGAMAIGVALASVLRRGEVATPGDLAGVLAFVAVVLIAAADPLRRWVTVFPLAQAAHPGRSAMLWLTVVIACAAVTLACARDPGRPRHRPGPANSRPLRRGTANAISRSRR
jgi:Na+/proline symporter